ncbi:DNA-directed DNA polymerase alpha subunit [Martiniozyma asiatica (nom. inval.)]|nr:DNA-directed DNA polymerase alpha subunit [Martiniozyma asiatica]
MVTSYTKLFGAVADQPEISSKLHDIAKLFNYSPDDLLIQWETFKSTVYHDTTAALTEEKLTSLQTHIQDKLERQAQYSNNIGTPKFGKVKAVPKTSSLKKHGMNIQNTHLLKKRKLNFSSPANTSVEIPSDADVSFNNTTLANAASGTILESLAPTNLPAKETTETEKPISIIANFNSKKYKFRTQNIKPLEIADYLDDQLDRFAELIQKHHKITLEEFGDPTRMSQTEIVAIGRIVPETPTTTSDTELNLDSLFLETARDGPHAGFGKRVRLDFTQLKSQFDSEGIAKSFFPGQLIACRGENNNGSSFNITSLIKIPYLGAGAYSSDDVEDFARTFNGSDDNLKISIAAGPYHRKSALDFTYLESFVDQMNISKPDVIIMFGPFIDIKLLSKISYESIPQELNTVEELFRHFITPILSRLTCQKIIILPHAQDATTAHAVYPQAAFSRKELGLPREFKPFPDPCVFHINEIGIGSTNVDVLRGLKDVTIGNENRIDRIVSNILEQRHFHPHMTSMANENANFDVSYFGLAEIEDELPDVLILPSILKRFVKIVKNVVVINPGQLVKGDNGGTFAMLQVAKPKCEPRRPKLNEHGEPTENENQNWCMGKVARDIGDGDLVEEYICDIWKRSRVDLYSI